MPLLRLPLWAIARTSQPVFSSAVCHPLPEVDRVVAAERRERRVGLDEDRLRPVSAEDDVAVQVVAARVRGPLEADERREPAGLVVGLGGLDDFLPGRAVGARAGHREPLRHLVRAEALDDVERGLHALAGLDQVVPLAALLRREQLGVAAHELREEPEAVGVVRDDEEVERARELHGLAAGGRDLLAAREPVGLAGREPRARGAGVHRERGVQVRVAEERPHREVAPRVRRVDGLLRERLLDGGLVGLAGVLGERRSRHPQGHEGSDRESAARFQSHCGLLFRGQNARPPDWRA